MKKSIKIIFGIIAIAFIVAVSYWQFNKKSIVKNALENAITKKTDSLYYIHYDSSGIDAVKGNASFYNVVLQSDSLQKQLADFDTSSAELIYNIHIAEVSITGANIPALVGNEKVEAASIHIIKPVIYIINSGTKKEHVFSSRDTLSIYEKLLGKFSSIKASEIIIEDGQVNFTHKIQTPYAILNGININMKNMLIDSTKNYDNIISYFVKDINLEVKNTVIKNEEKNSELKFTGLQYNAAQKLLKLENFQQTNHETNKVVFDISNTFITGLNTDSFIIKKLLKAEELTSDGGLMVFYRKQLKDTTKKTNNDILEIDNNFFDEALLNKITLNNTKIIVYNKDEPKEDPFVLTGVRFSASGIQNVYSGVSVKNIISKSNWSLAATGFSFLTKDKIYQMSVGPFNINKETGKMHIDYFRISPQLTEAAYVKGLKEQTDLYNIAVNDIDLEGVDTRQLLENKQLIIQKATIHPTLRVSCDRTIAAFTGSKIGNYPHQLIQKLKFPIYIKTIYVKNAYISYTERGTQSRRQGTVFFNNANGTIENVTNIKERIAANKNMLVNATAKLMGKSGLQTNWKLPLDTKNGEFIISGHGDGFDAKILNPLIEPLALAHIDKGTIKSLDFNMQGNDDGLKGTSTLLYNDLKVGAVKRNSGKYKKRGLVSFIANLAIKDDNPENGNVRVGETNIERDKTRSFFNLVWKGIFKAAKRTALGKDDE